MKLSIGLIMKNEEKHIRRCMEGLKKITSEIEAEIIIHDTGSTDNSVAIAKEYTPYVYQIEWRKDFAWARNHGLRMARGEWFMFIDVDEEVIDGTAIVDFFKTGEYRNYFAALVEMINIVDDKETVTILPARLFKRDPQTRFYGKIHEYIPVRSPHTHLKTYIKHWGYNFANEAEAKVKHERNMKPMLEIYEAEPKNTRNMLLIVEQLISAADYEEAGKFIDRQLEVHREKPESKYKKDPWYLSAIFQLMKLAYFQQDHKKLIEVVDDYEKEHDMDYAHCINMLSFRCTAHTKLKNYKEAQRDALQAHDLFEKNLLGELKSTTNAMIGMLMVDEKSRNFYLNTIVISSVHVGDFSTAMTYNLKIENAKTSPYDVARVFSDSIRETQAYQHVSKMYCFIREYYKEENELNEALAAIDEVLSFSRIKSKVGLASYDELKEGSYANDDFVRLYGLWNYFAKYKKSHTAVPDITQETPTEKIDFTEEQEKEDTQRFYSELGYFLSEEGPNSYVYADIIGFAAVMKRNFTNFLKRVVIIDTNNFVFNLRDSFPSLREGLLSYLLDNKFIEKESSIKAMRLLVALGAGLVDVNRSSLVSGFTKEKMGSMGFGKVVDLYEEQKQEEEETNLQFFEVYTLLRDKYLRATILPEVYNEKEVYNLPEQDAFAFFAATAFRYRDSGNTADFAAYLRKALKVLPYTKGIISLIGTRLKQQIEKPTVHDELNKEITQLKDLLKIMINTGNKKEAALVLDSYAEVNPTDPEIPSLRESLY